MESTLTRQKVRERVDLILQRGDFSSRHYDVTITINTDRQSRYVIKNDFSVRVKKQPVQPDNDFIVSLWDLDYDLYFTRFGNLVKIVQNPNHSLYAERCCCKLYKSTVKSEFKDCFDQACIHGNECATKRRGITLEMIRNLETAILAIKAQNHHSNNVNE